MDRDDSELYNAYEQICEGLFDRLATRTGHALRAPVKLASRGANAILNQGLPPEDRERVQQNIKNSAKYDSAMQYANRLSREITGDLVKLKLISDDEAAGFVTELQDHFKSFFRTKFYGDQEPGANGPHRIPPQGPSGIPPSTRPGAPKPSPGVPSAETDDIFTFPAGMYPGRFAGVTIHPSGTVEIVPAANSSDMLRDINLYINAVMRLGIQLEKWHAYLLQQGYTHQDIRNVINTIKAGQSVMSHQARQQAQEVTPPAVKPGAPRRYAPQPPKT